MATGARTSLTHPIRVDWLKIPWPGRVGLTFAPGKKQPNAATGAWDRDLAVDLAGLRAEGADHLVCLIEDHELAELSIDGLEVEARVAGIALHRLPIQDGSLPADDAAVAKLVSGVAGWAAAGENVVIHCKGGLGRAGTIGGCVLRAAGLEGPEALAALQDARGPSCPETNEQRRYIERFVPGPPSRESRVMGSVLGAAIGDALGHPTEFLLAAGIREKYGPAGVTGFELWWERDGQRFAPYTDDTQMAEVVLRTLAEHGRGADMDTVMTQMSAGFVAWANAPQGGHRAPGNACMAGARALERGVAWREAGGASAGGCGSVMRAYPFGLLSADDAERAELWAVEHSRMTHRDPIALAACAAMAVGMAAEMQGVAPKAVSELMVAAAGRHDAVTARMGEAAVADAEAGVPPEVVLARLQGWAAHEAIAAAMYVVARHERDIRGALLEGANAPGDSDSIATLAGALLGARLGLEALPVEWVRDVERSRELMGLARGLAVG